MSIDRAAKEAGIPLDRDVPEPGHRRCRDWAKIIGLCRKLEDEERRVLEEERQNSRRVEIKYAELLEKLHSLERENEQLKLRERMRAIELSRKDQEFLLEGPQEEAA